MADIEKTLEEVLREVRDELGRLNSECSLSLPRYSLEDGLRIVEQTPTARSVSKAPARTQAA